MAIEFAAAVAKVGETILEAAEKVAEATSELSENLAETVSDISPEDINIDELDEPISEGMEESSFSQNEQNTENLDDPISESVQNSDNRNCPLENGEWTGERGNSKWIPDEDYVFKKCNPDGLTAKEIFDQYDIDGIDFQDGEPDFSPISKGEVKIDEFSGHRPDNFDQADMKLAETKGCTPEEVEKWRNENKYTWHESKDMSTMNKVPSVIHINVAHRGGISAYKNGG